MTDRPQASPRIPLLWLFLSAAVWLVIGSLFGLIASIKFHSPSFLADIPFLSYGRVYPVYLDSLLYGFALQAGLGVTLWLLGHLGRTTLALGGAVVAGAVLWNLGVTLGLISVLAGQSTGFRNLEIPGHAAVLIFLGYLLMALSGVLTFHHRRERRLFVSQWFLFAALFWFPWLYSTANLLLVSFPVRGVVQAVIDWWFSDNLIIVWLGLVGLGVVFYFVPKLARRDLHSDYLAVFTFWTFMLFASWGGIPSAAPVPAWMPTLSAVATVLTLVPILAVAVNLYASLGRFALFSPANPALSFILFGAAAFMVAGLMRVFGALLDFSQMLSFTWFTPASTLLHLYGFFALVLFGAVYHILPELTGLEFRSPRLVRAHFWLAAGGIVLIVVPLAVGGVIQALELENAQAFGAIFKSGLLFLRVSTVGDLLLLVGHLLFLVNLASLAVQFYRARALAAYAAVTADLFKAAEARP